MNYIESFQKEVPDWKMQSNQMCAQVGFATDAYWQWALKSMGEICLKYNDNDLVVDQFILLFEWLEKQAERVKQ